MVAAQVLFWAHTYNWLFEPWRDADLSEETATELKAAMRSECEVVAAGEVPTSAVCTHLGRVQRRHRCNCWGGAGVRHRHFACDIATSRAFRPLLLPMGL